MKYKLMFLTSAIIVVFAVALYSAEEFNTKKADELYKKHCSKCHRNNGEGIKKVYPPVKNADYIKKATTDELLRGMLFGRSGKIVVNGVSYNGVMTTEIDGRHSSDAYIHLPKF